jgi:protein phosphatase
MRSAERADDPMRQETSDPFTFTSGAASHVGRVRTTNEDRFLTRPDLGLWAVADGMGGHEAGEVASATVAAELDSVGRAVSASDLLARLEDRIIRANAALRALSAERGAMIGTTLAALIVYGPHYACVWCGDSRIYQLRDARLRQLTRDHSEVQDLVDGGLMTAEQARASPRRNVLTRAIGVSPQPELDLVQDTLQAGDRFLLCSDGLYDPVGEADLTRLLAAHEPQEACDRLIGLALDRGATDNVTAVVLSCGARP